ncbi:lysylphosphatidylglycerol synthase domain-containing protein [Micromonospora soli]|uniref:lysylphosphatidylglycerol synthase domain-containing protein n=1 Tax=Micromonospora sp. NBRC 110009 TaxID=3061627 RepID=UPI00267111AA|nr:lysylphosphatidylglycerol synthase domain-containing protein [Micromonospora sp. NBRC 110009]WKT98187.1 lysylphosphatidylglycerol synthase domain-containing protein [Micromonospora sp. NBRC 110009]
MPRSHRPSPALVLGLVVSGALFTLVSSWARHRPPGRWERDLFVLVNQLPGPVGPVLLLVMQLGAYPAILVAAVGAVAARQWRLARDLLIAGNLAYWAAALAKLLVARARPAGFLADVRFHEAVGGRFGYPSGHVAVATALAVVLAPAVPRRLRGLLWLAVALVATARLYVGAHLPVDVLGGFLAGWFAASLTRVAVGDVGPRGTAGRLRQVLLGLGIEAAELTPVAGDARGSRPWQVTTTGGRRRFVKVTGGSQRDADWLYTLYRRLRYRGIADEPPYLTAKQKCTHEAYLLMRAERAGVRTPRLVTTATDPGGDALLVQEFAPGRPLDALDPAELDRDTLDDVCRQVARLHRAGLAHRDLRAANLLVAGATAWLVGLSHGTDEATADQRARDLVELLVTLAALAGVPAAVDAATGQLGTGPVADTLPWLQPALLSRAGRALADSRPGLLDDLRDEIARRCPGRSDHLARVVRITRRDVFLLVMLGLLVHFLLPQIGAVRAALHAVLHANPLAVTGALLASAATYLLSAEALRLAAASRLPPGRTLAVQFAASFVNPLAPGALGGAALTVRYLRQQGLTVPAAATAVAVDRVAGVLGVALLLPVLLPFARGTRRHLASAATGRGLAVLLTVLAVLLLAAVVFAVPRWRTRVRAARRQAVEALRALARSGRIVPLLAVSVALTLAYAAAFWLALLGVGLPADPALIAPVVLVCIVGEGLSTAAPTPGGLGATEAALVSGLLLYGVRPETAVAGVLVYRLATFWLPVLPGYVALRGLVRRHAV